MQTDLFLETIWQILQKYLLSLNTVKVNETIFNSVGRFYRFTEAYLFQKSNYS